MSNEPNFLDIVLLGKEYRVACPPEEKGALLQAVAYVDAKMHEIAEKTKSNIAERIAVMVALNIAHEYLSKGAAGLTADGVADAIVGRDLVSLKGRISSMEAQIDAVLHQQQELV